MSRGLFVVALCSEHPLTAKAGPSWNVPEAKPKLIRSNNFAFLRSTINKFRVVGDDKIEYGRPWKHKLT